MLGRPWPCVVADVTSAFPLVAYFCGWWDLLIAGRLLRRDVTTELRALCAAAVISPAALLDPAVWRQFGLTLVEVQPNGEPFPVEVEDPARPDGRLEVVPLFSPGRSMFFPWQVAAAAAVLAGRVPTILRATAYQPEARRATLRRSVPLLPNLDLDRDSDPALVVARFRQHLKRRQEPGDAELAAELRVIVNSLVFGLPARFDEVAVPAKDGGGIAERPGPMNFLALASAVSGGALLLLAVFDRLVRRLGGLVLYRDTDSSIVLASPGGGSCRLDSGEAVRVLSWQDVDEVLACFNRLRVIDEDVPVWKLNRCESLHTVVFSPKVHVEFLRTEAGNIILERTESRLGGFYADPPTMAGRAPDGKRLFSLAAAQREVDYAVAREEDASKATRPMPPWDEGQPLPFPGIRRLVVTTPEVLRSIPESLGARLGTRYLEAAVDPGLSRQRPSSLVALDPGGDLSHWTCLRWLDRTTGEARRVTTHPVDRDALSLVTLDRRSIEWSQLPTSKLITEVVVDPRNVVHVGRVSGVIDADVEGLPGDLDLRRPVYEVVVRRCQLPGCEEPLRRANQRYCRPTHGDRAYRLRRKAKRPSRS